MPQHRADQITARASVSPVMTAAGASTHPRPQPRPILRSTPQISVVIPTVLAINAVTLWHALRASGVMDQLHGFGTLLREH